MWTESFLSSLTFNCFECWLQKLRTDFVIWLESTVKFSTLVLVFPHKTECSHYDERVWCEMKVCNRAMKMFMSVSKITSNRIVWNMLCKPKEASQFAGLCYTEYLLVLRHYSEHLFDITFLSFFSLFLSLLKGNGDGDDEEKHLNIRWRRYYETVSVHESGH